MTRKDYVAIAAALAQNTRDYMGQSNVDPQAMSADIAWSIADVMARDNPRFDRERFLKACGVQS